MGAHGVLQFGCTLQPIELRCLGFGLLQLHGQLAGVLWALQQARQHWCGRLSTHASGEAAQLLQELQAAAPSVAWQAAARDTAAEEGASEGADAAAPSAEQLRQLPPEAEALAALLLRCLSLPEEAAAAAHLQAMATTTRCCAYLRCANLAGLTEREAAGKRNKACSACLMVRCERGMGWGSVMATRRQGREVLEGAGWRRRMQSTRCHPPPCAQTAPRSALN